ncbi:macrophage mannose receptor 1-like isoform X2 [Alligator sinensis]|uniref:Macrophage mannose receptor 1 n=1 Tax=Alligator sinensis TaxID=38654 RepID=A0A3Q0H1I4_ALLSI|nr:macrophage mannose receptor 1-like isoform X2 [Alligator sinensis]
MSLFRFLGFLSLIYSAVQLFDNEIFLIYNEDNKYCVQAQSSSSVITAPCDQNAISQKFKWVSVHQIMSLAFTLCLAVPSKKEQVQVFLYPCNKTSQVQQWECRNETLLAIQGEDLFFSSGSRTKENIMLHKGSGVKSKWKIHGTSDGLCSWGYEDLYTLLGNANGAPCIFPFQMNGKWYSECTDAGRSDSLLWCATTPDFDTDQLYGFCPLNNNSTDRLWTTDALTGVHYQINFQSALTWHQARTSCQQQNAELLSITEMYEEKYLTDLIDNRRSSLWIGLNSLNSSNGWQWVGGSPFRYLNWASGSPSPDPGKNCAVLNPRRDVKWENKECNKKFGYICKRGNSTFESSFLPSEPINCPNGWRSYGGHCYMIHREPKVWKEALTACEKEDSSLASIHNSEEHNFIVYQLGFQPSDKLWIGFNDLRIQMYFEWSDRTPVTYTKWLQEETTHANNGEEDCVAMKGQDGYWAHETCDKELGYICKRNPLQGAPGTIQNTNPSCPKGWKMHGFYCYLIGYITVPFWEAKKTCERSNSHLTTIQDRYEQAYLTSLVGLRPENYFWIGLSYMEKQGTFKWTSGEAVLFTHWNSAMPGSKRGCVAIRTGIAAGLWDVQNCEEKAKFLCKQLAEAATLHPIPETMTNLICPMGWDSDYSISSCFKPFMRERNQKKSWLEAQNYCREIGGDLASINSGDEQYMIEHLVIDRSLTDQPFWIGLFYLDPDEGFLWSDGSLMSYGNWHASYDYNNPGIDLCGTVSKETSMKWSNMQCDHFYDWICEIRKGTPLKPEPKSSSAKYEVTEDGWIINGDKQYFFSKESVPMAKARVFCKKSFGDLAVIESNSERKFLWKYILRNGKSESYTIGLIQSVDRQFAWLDGSPVHYAAWASNEPNFANAEENCVAIHKNSGLWNDINCYYPNAFICERHNTSINSTFAPTEPSPPGGCLEDWLLFKNKCYTFFGSRYEDRVNWFVAQKTCMNFGGNLASIPNEQVQAFLTYNLKDASSDSWIGLSNRNKGRISLWKDGSDVSYTNWDAEDRMHSAFGFQYPKSCVVIKTSPLEKTGKWMIEGCSQRRGFICQKKSDSKLYKPLTAIPNDGFSHFGDSSYSLIQSKMTWEEARKNCMDRSSELASILDPYSQSFVWLLMLEHGNPVWIGLNSNVTNGNYKWIDTWRMDYTQWASKEPKQTIACVYVDLNGMWKTGSCTKKYFSVCKLSDVMAPTDPPQLPGKCPESERYSSWIPFHGHCYYIEFLKSRNWMEASLECRQDPTEA